MSTTIIHVSEVNLHREGGMARVEYYWKEAFEKRGVNFIHIGPNETGAIRHPGLFPIKAYRYYKQLNLSPSAIIVHEPASGPFMKEKAVSFIESHGVERRFWEFQLKHPALLGEHLSLRTKLLYPLWRLRGCDKGLKKGNKLLLINRDDANYVKKRYNRVDKDILLFKNGVFPLLQEKRESRQTFTILFNGSWIKRKGTDILVKAASLLYAQGISIYYLLAGTGKNLPDVMNDWPHFLHSSVTVIPNFSKDEESLFLKKADLFVLPSYFEGQPLSLLQAMAVGLCCITTNCCGQKDIIRNGENGLLFQTGSAEELASLIKQCFDNDNIRLRLGNNARLSVQNRLWVDVCNEMADFVMKNF